MTELKYQSLRKALSVFDLLLGDQYRSAPELAREVGCRSRTVQDYLGVFQEYGWPIDSSHARGYKLAEGAAARLTERELLLLAILLAHGSSVLPAGDFEKLAVKITQLLPDAARNTVRNLNSKVQTPLTSVRDLETLAAIGRCFSDPRCQLVVDYQKSGRSGTERRNILPLALRYQDGSCYVDSLDLDKNGARSYRLDRFVKTSLLRQEHPISRVPTDEVLETHKWDFGDGELTNVKIKVRAPLAAWLEEKPVHSTQSIVRDGDNFLVSFQIRKLELFVDWVMSLRGAQAIEPPELVSRVKLRAQTILEQSGTLNVHWE